MARSSSGDLPAGLLGNDRMPTEGPPGAEIGAVTQSPSPTGWGAFVDEQEYVPELQWPQSVISYHRMRSDSQVEALYTGTSQPVREFRWSVDPNKAPPKLVEQAAADLGLPIRGHEDDAIPRARNSFDFDTFLADAMLSMLYGYFHFETVGDVVEDQEWRMDRLSPRHPRTIAEFKQSRSGDLEAIRQSIGGAAMGWQALPPPIPAFKLVPVVWRAEAGSLVGRSLLRAIFREWMVKDRTIRVAAINLERGSGIPVIEGAPGMSDAQIRDLAELARQFKVAEGGGGAVPYGTKLTLVGGNVPQAIDLLKYCDECMARVWALMLVQLGMTQTGNRALGAEFAIYAARAQRAIAKWIATGVNRFLDNYVEWNDPFVNYAPLLHYEQSKPDAMSITDFVSLVEAKALIVDPELEEWLRSEHGLPQYPPGLARPTPAAEENGAPPSKPSPTLDPTSQAPTLASSATAHPSGVERVFRGIRASLTLPNRQLRRPPNAGEIRAAVDFASLDAAHTLASEKLWQAFAQDILPTQAKEIGDAIRSLPALSRTAAASLTLAPSGEDVLHEHLLEAAKNGAATARRELEAQGVTGVTVDEGKLAARIADQAQAVAALNANGVSLAAQRKAQSLVSTATAGRSPDQIAAEVESHLLGMKHAWTKEQLRGAVTMAQNQGRIATFTESAGETEPTYQASEILDDRTCGPCEAIDGKVYANLEEAEADYAAGGFVDCEGGPNCRGTLVAVHDEQNPASEGGRVGEGETPPVRPSDEAEEPGPGTPDIPGVETPERVPINESSAIETGEDVSNFLEGVDFPNIPIDFGRLDDTARSGAGGEGRTERRRLAHGARGVLQETAQAIADVKVKLGPEATRIDSIVPNSKARGAFERLDNGTFAAVAYVPATRGQRLIINDLVPQKLADRNLAGSHTGQLSKATFDTYGRTLHEMGHVYLNNVPGPPMVKGVGERLAERIMRDAGLGPGVTEDGNLISRYSLENTHEGFAEIFATLMRPGAVDYDYGAGNKAIDERVKGKLRDFREKWNAVLDTNRIDYARLPAIEPGPPQPPPPAGIQEGRRPVGRPTNTRLVREARDGSFHALTDVIPTLIAAAKTDAAMIDVGHDIVGKGSEWAIVKDAIGASQGGAKGAGEEQGDLKTKEAADEAKDLRERLAEKPETIELVEEAIDNNEVNRLWQAVLANLVTDLVAVTQPGAAMPFIDPKPGATAARVSGTTFIPEAVVHAAGAPGLGLIMRRAYGESIANLLSGTEARAIMRLMPEPGDELVAGGAGIAELFATLTDPRFKATRSPNVTRAGFALLAKLNMQETPWEIEAEEELEAVPKGTRGETERE